LKKVVIYVSSLSFGRRNETLTPSLDAMVEIHSFAPQFVDSIDSSDPFDSIHSWFRPDSIDSIDYRRLTKRHGIAGV
jgi:hypothetical protein